MLKGQASFLYTPYGSMSKPYLQLRHFLVFLQEFNCFRFLYSRHTISIEQHKKKKNPCPLFQECSFKREGKLKKSNVHHDRHRTYSISPLFLEDLLQLYYIIFSAARECNPKLEPSAEFMWATRKHAVQSSCTTTILRIFHCP